MRLCVLLLNKIISIWSTLKDCVSHVEDLRDLMGVETMCNSKFECKSVHSNKKLGWLSKTNIVKIIIFLRFLRFMLT